MCKSVARPIRYTSGPRAGSCGKNNGNRRAMSMSAICGWFAIDTSSPVEQIEAMTRALPCPDTAHTIPQAAPDRALAAASASFFHARALWIACEGAPYFNAPALRALAERDGIAAAIAEGYRRRGRECLAEIQGAFAIALLDTVAQRALLAVDRLGIRPLCLARAGSGLVIASSARAVAAHRDVAGGIDPQSVYDYLYFHMVPSPRTIHLGVEKLLPGQYAVFENGRLEKGFYWRMRYGADRTPAGDGGDELFGGNARYVKQKTFELYYNVPAALRRALIEPLAFHI